MRLSHPWESLTHSKSGANAIMFLRFCANRQPAICWHLRPCERSGAFQRAGARRPLRRAVIRSSAPAPGHLARTQIHGAAVPSVSGTARADTCGGGGVTGRHTAGCDAVTQRRYSHQRWLAEHICGGVSTWQRPPRQQAATKCDATGAPTPRLAGFRRPSGPPINQSSLKVTLLVWR